MRKKLITWTNIIIILIIVIVIVLVGLKFDKKTIKIQNDCVDVNHVTSLVYDACYDKTTKNIFLEIKRSYDTYNIKKIKINYSEPKEFITTDIPNIGENTRYKIQTNQNPVNILMSLEIVKDFSAPLCEIPRTLIIKDCNENVSNTNISINVISGINNFKPSNLVSETLQKDSDTLNAELINKEKIWKALCTSKWSCNPWGQCLKGIQKRECKDLNNCQIPTDLPGLTRYCNDTCEESWGCEWSQCINGYTTPTCKDRNFCGTKYTIPEKLECKSNEKKCNPDVTCTEWSECKADYNFFDIINGVENINGITSRTCTDRNLCAQTKYETKECAITMDIYILQFEKCGKEYTGVYNKLNNQMIARIEQSKDEKNPYLNIDLAEGQEIDDYCDSCQNGVKDTGETEIDCGGTCPSCLLKQKKVFKRTILERISDFFFNLIKSI